MARNLNRLFNPKSLAVFGGNWAENVILQCQKMGYAGKIWPVHPNRSTMAGIPCFPAIESLPHAPDCSFIGVNRHQTIAIVEALANRGAGGAICFAAGFAETAEKNKHNVSLQDQLCAGAHNMPVIGPNCYGFINYLDNVPVWPDQQGGISVSSGVAILTQSSNIALNITMQIRGLPIAFVGTAGNQAQTTLADMALHLLNDPRITALGLHIEGFKEIEAYENLAALAHDLNKPIVALKTGRSQQAQRATISHTASLAGNDAGADALLSRLGIVRVASIAELLETLKLLHVTGPLANNAIASLSCSGGEASLIADAILDTPLELPPFNSAQINALRMVLGEKVHLENPLDYHTFIWGDLEGMTDVFINVMTGEFSLVCLILDFPRTDRCRDTDWKKTVSALERACKKSGKKAAVISSLPENLPENWAYDLIEKGIAPLSGLSDSIAAITNAVWLGRRHKISAPLLCAKSTADSKASLLDEFDAKNLLAHYGLKIPVGKKISSIEEASAEAAKMGYPVVLKNLGLAHKTERQGLKLNLKNPAEVEAAIKHLAKFSNTFLLEPYITDCVCEILIGVIRDRAHGFLLTLGAGGVFTEIFQDHQHLLLPTTRDDVKAALRRLKIWPRLVGFRGMKAADIEALVDATMAIGDFVAAHADLIEEVEINPFITLPNGGYAVDALLQMRKT